MSIPAAQNAQIRTTVLTALAFLSGCCALAYEVLYMRALTTLLGDMLYVHAALLSTFLIGIALGAKLAHHGVRWLWAFEILTGVYAVSMPAVSRWLAAQPLMVDITASPAWTIVATIGFLSIPSLLIGFSIPLFSAYVKAHSAGRLSFQGIYVAYNLGALLSILAVELILVRELGVTLSLALVGAINVFNGVVLLALREAPEVHREERRRFSRRIVLALALASLSSAAFQMFFLKLTYVVFGPHRENFAISLAVTLFGIFLGAWLAPRVRLSFAGFLVLVPLTIGLIYTAYPALLRLHHATEVVGVGSELGVLLNKFAMGCLFALGPMILFGATLPALMRSEGEVAAESGHLLWVSSLANAAGYLAYVLLGHPLLGGAVLLALLAALPLLGSLLAAGRWSRWQWGAALAGAALVVALLATWDDRRFYLAQWVDQLDPEDEVLVFKSGAESATLIREEDYAWVSYNGHPSIDVQQDGVVNIAETLSGVIPALAAPSLERALVLGLGTGITGGATARIFETTDVVEINDAFFKMMPELRYASLDIANNPAARLHLADGRSFLVGRDGEYDAILNSIPAPTYYSAAKIYTVEFYERVARALKPDGVFCSWLSASNMSEEGLHTVLAAIHESFRYCDLRMMTRSYYMATCANDPIRVRHFRELPVDLGLVDQLQLGLPGFDLDEFFEDTRISDNIFARYTPPDAVRNTDDHPVLEFMVVRNYQIGEMGEDPFLERQARMNVDPVRAGELDDPARLARRAAAFYALGADHFRANFLPLLQADPELWALWQDWGLGDDPFR